MKRKFLQIFAFSFLALGQLKAQTASLNTGSVAGYLRQSDECLGTSNHPINDIKNFTANPGQTFMAQSPYPGGCGDRHNTFSWSFANNSRSYGDYTLTINNDYRHCAYGGGNDRCGTSAESRFTYKSSLTLPGNNSWSISVDVNYQESQYLAYSDQIIQVTTRNIITNATTTSNMAVAPGGNQAHIALTNMPAGVYDISIIFPNMGVQYVGPTGGPFVPTTGNASYSVQIRIL